MPARDLEVAVLDRTRTQQRKFKRIAHRSWSASWATAAGRRRSRRGRQPGRPDENGATSRPQTPAPEAPSADPTVPATTTSRRALTADLPTQPTCVWARGPADLRHRERVRRHVHVQGPAPPLAGRGRPLPVPQGGLLGPQQQRVPPQRRPALPRRRQPPGVRHPRVRRHRRPGHPRQGGGAGPRGAARRRRAAAARRGHRRRRLPVQEQHRLGRQLLRLPRELPGQPARRVQPAGRRADPVPGHPPDHRAAPAR